MSFVTSVKLSRGTVHRRNKRLEGLQSIAYSRVSIVQWNNVNEAPSGEVAGNSNGKRWSRRV